jgi:hypothetical protein
MFKIQHQGRIYLMVDQHQAATSNKVENKKQQWKRPELIEVDLLLGKTPNPVEQNVGTIQGS